MFYNAFNNLRRAWYSHQIEDQQNEWTQTSVTIRLAKDVKHSKSFFLRCVSIYKVFKNTFLLIKNGPFQLHAAALALGNGRFRSITTNHTLLKTVVLITDPNIMQAILRHERNESGPHAMISGGFTTDVAQLVLGQNLLSLEDKDHQQLRALVAPHLYRVKRFAGHMALFANRVLDKCPELYRPGDFFPKFMVEIVSGCYLNYTCNAEEITKTIETLLATVGKSQQINQFREAQNRLEQFAKDAPSSSLIDDIPSDQRLTFIKLMFFAGQDTTTALIEYLLLTLGHEKKWQDELYTQWLSSKQSLSDFAESNSLLDLIIKESIRLHPPSFEQTRTVLQDIELDNGYLIKAGSELHLMHYYSQREVRRWGQDASEFNPLRYENPRSSHVSFPFSSGPTACLGRQFAVTFVKIILMTFISKYQWKSQTKIEGLEGKVALKIIPSPLIELSRRGFV